MQQLHLVGFTADNRGLIFSARKGAKSGGFVVTIDDKMLARVDELVARREAEEGVQSANRPRSSLSPREIQARLRAGRTISQVAREAGVEEEWVARWAAPILAEQGQVVERAQELTLERNRIGPSTVPLGEAVRWNMAEKGIVFTDAGWSGSWDAFHLRGNSWIVRFSYAYRRKTNQAEWEVDTREGTIASRNRQGTELGYVAPGRRRPRTPRTLVAPVEPPPPPVAASSQSTAERPAGGKRTSARKSTAKKSPAKSGAKRPAPRKKATAKKATAKKATSKKATAKKATAKKATAKKAAKKKSVASKAAGRRAVTKKAGAKKAGTKKAARKGTPPKRSAARKSAKKSTPSRKATSTRTPARKGAARKSGASRRPAAKKSTPRATPRQATAKKATTNKAGTKKATPRKRAAKKSAPLPAARTAPATNPAPPPSRPAPARPTPARAQTRRPAPSRPESRRQPATTRPEPRRPRARRDEPQAGEDREAAPSQRPEVVETFPRPASRTPIRIDSGVPRRTEGASPIIHADRAADQQGGESAPTTGGPANGGGRPGRFRFRRGRDR